MLTFDDVTKRYGETVALQRTDLHIAAEETMLNANSSKI